MPNEECAHKCLLAVTLISTGLEWHLLEARCRSCRHSLHLCLCWSGRLGHSFFLSSIGTTRPPLQLVHRLIKFLHGVHPYHPLHSEQRAGSLCSSLPSVCPICVIELCQAANSVTALGGYKLWLAVQPTAAAALEGNITCQDRVRDVLSHEFQRYFNTHTCCCSQKRQPTVGWSLAACKLPHFVWLSDLGKAD
jgi:hypothetical protein